MHEGAALSLFDDPTQPQPVVLSYGMGVDSTAILLRWLHEPTSRDFDLDDLIVVTAMTGDEFADTIRLVDEHLLPRLAGVRFVQLARGGPSNRDGLAVLSDSRTTTTVVRRGPWTLADELALAGTVPQVAAGRRRCSIKFKGWPIDTFLAGELAGRSFRHVMGFNAEESGRAERDASYSTEVRVSEYPLIEWGWDRAACETYIAELVGEPWAKSCCEYCPFARDNHQARYADDLDAAVRSMHLELRSLALNPRSTMFAQRSLIDVTEAHHPLAAARFAASLDDQPWALYDVRRLYHGPGTAWRAVRTLEEGPRDRLHRVLATHGPVFESGRCRRVLLHERIESYPSAEHFLVVGPAGVADKRRDGFDDWWVRLTGPPTLTLTLEHACP